MKTGIAQTEESTGAMPAMGARVKIEGIERGKVAANAQFGVPGALQYIAKLSVVEPKQYKGTPLTVYFEIGTEDDPKARNPETWQRTGDPAHLKRLLVRSGTPITDDDDEVWMEAAVGNTVCIHTTVNAKGYTNVNKRDSFFRETDEDFVGVGVKIEAPAAAGKVAPKKKPIVDDDDDEPVKAPAKAAAADDDDDDDKPAPKAKKKKPVADDED